MNNNSKICSICKIEKSIFDFYKTSNAGLFSYCKSCHKQKALDWKINNPERRKAIDKKNGSKWAKDNPEKNRLKANQWAKDNPEKVANKYHKRKATLQNCKSFYIRNSFLIKLYKSNCVICGSAENIEADHIIPISRGGIHGESNLQPLCKNCNSSKGAKTMSEWLLG